MFYCQLRLRTKKYFPCIICRFRAIITYEKEVYAMQRLNPGDIAPQTGCYNVIDGNGKVLDTVTVKKGNRMPPTQSSDYYYEFANC